MAWGGEGVARGSGERRLEETERSESGRSGGVGEGWGGEGEKDPRTENKDGNEKQDGIKMLGIIKKEVLFLPVPCCILRIPLE